MWPRARRASTPWRGSWGASGSRSSSWEVLAAPAGLTTRRGESRQTVLDEIRDAMAGGAAGLAVGRVVFQDPEPAVMARLVAEAVRDGAGTAGTAGTVSA